MPNFYSLDTLRSDLDREFAPLELDLGSGRVVLRNLMRINDKDRTAVLQSLAQLEDIDTDENETSLTDITLLAEAVEFILRTVAADGRGDTLVQALNGDMLLGLRIIERWSEATQAPEAQDSPA
ncbi:phage tail assembly protein [Kibdelosporangium lantanae]|uniref:Phage tail assembly protein n=1 Tax=Kibdelosporangium lantanae TaxID=1497396 RepID=A0ABW3M6M8_9PSEU